MLWIVIVVVLRNFCEKDGRENPLLWRGAAKATTKIGNVQPDQANENFLPTQKRYGAGLAQIKNIN